LDQDSFAVSITATVIWWAFEWRSENIGDLHFYYMWIMLICICLQPTFVFPKRFSVQLCNIFFIVTSQVLMAAVWRSQLSGM
jgi:hypothetical protein